MENTLLAEQLGVVPSKETSAPALLSSFLLVFFIGSLLIFASEHFLVYDELYYNSFASTYSLERIQEAINQAHRWAWIVYPWLLITNLIRFASIAGCLSIGHYLWSGRWTFRPLFRIVIQAEVIMMIPLLYKIIWFLFVTPDYHFQDLQTFYPLSVANLVDYKHTELWLRYPLQVMSLFELIYWVFLVLSSKTVLQLSGRQAFNLVASSYGLGMLLWLIFIVFIVLTFT